MWRRWCLKGQRTLGRRQWEEKHEVAVLSNRSCEEKDYHICHFRREVGCCSCREREWWILQRLRSNLEGEERRGPTSRLLKHLINTITRFWELTVINYIHAMWCRPPHGRMQVTVIGEIGRSQHRLVNGPTRHAMIWC